MRGHSLANARNKFVAIVTTHHARHAAPFITPASPSRDHESLFSAKLIRSLIERIVCGAAR